MNRALSTDMTVIEHLTELRRRLIHCCIASLLGMLLCYLYSTDIIHFLTTPAGTLYYTRPAETFLLYIKLSLVCGILVASPVIFYELWAFLLPAFTKKEKKWLLLLVPTTLLLFTGGILFSYYIVLPQGLYFFLHFAEGTVQPLLSIESYLDFLLLFVLPFGVLGTLPLWIIILAVGGLITSATLSKFRRYAIIGAFVLSAIITPTPDVFSQCLLAVPMIVLYEGSRLFIRIFLKK